MKSKKNKDMEIGDGMGRDDRGGKRRDIEEKMEDGIERGTR